MARNKGSARGASRRKANSTSQATPTPEVENTKDTQENTVTNESLLKSPAKNGKESRPSSPLVKQRKTAKRKLEALNAQLANVIHRMEHAEPTEEDRAEVEAEVKSERDAVEAKIKEDLDNMHNAQKHCQQRLKDLAQETSAADQRVKELQATQRKQREENESLTTQAEVLQVDIAALEGEVAQVSEVVANAEKDRDETTEAWGRMEENFVDLENQLNKMTAEKNKQMSLVDALDEELALYEQEADIRTARNNADVNELKKAIKEVPKKFENEFKQLKAASEKDILGALNRTLERHTKELQEKNNRALEEATTKHITDEGVVVALGTKLKELKAGKKDLEVQQQALLESNETVLDLAAQLEKRRAKLAQLRIVYNDTKEECAKKIQDEEAKYQEVEGYRSGVVAVQDKLEKTIEEYARLLDYASNGFKRKHDGSDAELDASFLQPTNKRPRVENEDSFHVTITGVVSLKEVDPKGTKVLLENQTEEVVDLSGWHLVGVSHDKATARYDFDKDATLNARATVTIYTDEADFNRAIGASYLWKTDPVWSASKEGPSTMKLYHEGGLVSAATISVDESAEQSEGCNIM